MKMEERVSVRDNRARSKFCIKQNKSYGCRDAYMCNVSCPFWRWYETIRLMDLKNLSLGEAFRLSERGSITEEERKKIFRDRIGDKKVYPKREE